VQPNKNFSSHMEPTVAVRRGFAEFRKQHRDFI
jgi:hypothetical protein